jgi:hypothetical protein
MDKKTLEQAIKEKLEKDGVNKDVLDKVIVITGDDK